MPTTISTTPIATMTITKIRIITIRIRIKPLGLCARSGVQTVSEFLG